MSSVSVTRRGLGDMNYRLEFRGLPLQNPDAMTFAVGASALDVIRAMPGEVRYRPPTPQERWEDICRVIREQRYVLLRNPHEDEYDWD